ncbi:MAG TPA: hypothetical protein VGE06_03980 [Flavisolibacter sp.]
MPIMAVFAFLQYACSSTRQTVPSPIGLLPLDAYEYSGSILATDTVYRIIRNDADFDAAFQASSASVRRPAFYGQTVVAILLKTTPSVPLQFSRAEKQGKVVNVYAQTCSGCSSSRVVLATIPNVGDARSVRFFVNGEPRTTLGL